MRYFKWSGLFAAVVLIAACFLPWVLINSKQIVVSGVAAEGTNYGKPGYFHFLMAALFIVCSVIPRVWAKRFNLLLTALNMGWALRNFFIISICSGGECPVKQIGIYLMLISSALMLVASFFPDMKVPVRTNK